MININNQNYTVLGDIQVASQELKKWVELLTNNDEQLEQRFRDLCVAKGTVLSAIMHTRRQLLSQSNLKQELNMDDMEQFRQQLEQMFLEPVSIGYAKTILKVAKLNGYSSFDIINKHLENPEKRVWTIICCKNQYIA